MDSARSGSSRFWRERVRVLCETCRAQPALAARAGEGPARARRPKPAPKPERDLCGRELAPARVRGLEAAASARRAVRRPPRELPRRRDRREALQCVPSDRHGTGRRAVRYVDWPRGCSIGERIDGSAGPGSSSRRPSSAPFSARTTAQRRADVGRLPRRYDGPKNMREICAAAPAARTSSEARPCRIFPCSVLRLAKRRGRYTNEGQ